MDTPLVQQLTELASECAEDRRQHVAEVVPELLRQSDQFSDRERALLYDIAHAVIFDMEKDLRHALAEILAKRTDVPQALVGFLANDDIEVAYPVLVSSPLMRDADLLAVIAAKATPYHLAIARREQVSEDISSALINTGNVDVIDSLLRNTGAAIRASALAALVEKSRTFERLQAPLLSRDDLPPELAQRMFAWVSAVLRQHILDHFKVDRTLLEATLEEAVLQDVEKLTQKWRKAEQHQVDAVCAGDVLCTECMTTQLAAGRTHAFSKAFVQRTGVSTPLALQAMFDLDFKPMAVSCKAGGFGVVEFATVFALTRRLKPELSRTLYKDLRRALQFYDTFDQAAACDTVLSWTNCNDFDTALKKLIVH